MGIDQEAGQSGQGTLGRSLFADQVQDGVGADGAKRGREPGDEQGKLGIGDVGVRAQEVDRPVATGSRQRGEAVGPPEVDGGPIDQVLVARPDRDRTPAAIAEVEIIRRHPG